MSSLSAIWAYLVASGFTARVKKFFRENWLNMLILAAVLAGAWYIRHTGVEAGKAEANAEWVDKYDQAVRNFNKQLERLAAASEKAADKADKKVRQFDNKVDDVVETAKDRAEKQKKQGPKCPQSDLNTPLDPMFMTYWNQINRAAAEGVK